ncbi:C4-dicarboxylate ABC transporter substrate-binding protein [candidate division KSB3 bacterium]|uniref:C4-dicarboxylate ABC transporter substrate-binding protein n=1 Tax=candidate division KSB3 bacterium TaxID=2044937 RepID=A0A2G6E124_9BACT|nr:MAG: C4-dicarboxylate ABC transporter substrate-binding protein [candidate division KSB3 bacterium]PIE28328.1 MAG: C4-dicarboxylate ABC transporter substrate-binding protein [candidate division KSB3 bacterium]
MKIVHLFWHTLLFCPLIITSLVFVPVVQAEKPIQLSFSVFFPPTHPHAVASEKMAAEIEARSNGRVRITVFPGGTLTKAQAVYAGVVDGISDMGHSAFAYTRGRFPVMEAVDLPLGYPDGKTASKVAYEFYKTMAPKELQDVKVLTIHAHGPGILATTKDVSSLKDMKGMKIRSTGLSSKLAGQLGAAPVAMPQNAAYEALQKGVVEGTICPIETLKGWKQGEIIDYIIESKAFGYTTSMFVVMNKKKYNSLPEDIQKIFDEVGEEWVSVHGQVWDDADMDGRAFVTGLGKTIHALPAEEDARWNDKVQLLITEYQNAMKEKGIAGETAVELIKELLSNSPDRS